MRAGGAIALAAAQMSDASPNRDRYKTKDDGNQAAGEPAGGNQEQGPQHGGGKNAPHTNMDAKRSAQEKYEAAREKWQSLDRKPRKTPEDKIEAERAKREVDHWAQKARERGETHSWEPKGGRR